ncbi:MAG: diguanylate cyclase [Microbacteriaceae bacterium]
MTGAWWHPRALPGAMSLVIVALSGVLVVSFGGSADAASSHSAAAQGTIVTGLAAACLVGSLMVLVAAVLRRIAELALVGGGLTMLSGLTVVHGVAIGTGQAGLSWLAMAGAFPATAIVALPLIVGQGPTRRWIARWWGVWVSSWLLILIGTGAAILVARPRVRAEAPGSWLVVAAGLTILVTSRLAARQLDLHRIGRQRASLVAAVAFISLAAATVAGLSAAPASPRWWVAHGVNGASVVLAAAAAIVLARRSRSLATVLAPVLRDDPVAALELGLTPEVHAFIAALDRKDTITRDHTIRVGDLAVRTARRAGLPGARLRAIGLGGIMHDIGKLVVPSDILTKPGSLTDAQYAVMKSHAARGAALLEGSPELSEVAPLVRWHHERHDGGGYPDGLVADEIPFDVAIISVCDAWDALTNDRHYRTGRPAADAEAVLRGGAGTQWHPRAVDLVLREARATESAAPLAAVGHPTTAGSLASAVDCDVDCANLLGDGSEPTSRYERLFAEAPFAYFTVSPSGIITEANARASTMVERPPDQLVGSLVLDLYDDQPEGRPRAEALLAQFKRGEPIHDQVLAMRRADGETVWVRLTALPVFDDQGGLVESRSIAIDITDQRRAEHALRRLAFVDELTGLANRRAFLDELARITEAPPAPPGWVSIAFVDLDALKWINDRFTHALGDLALVDVAVALRQALPEGSLIARFGGDEFSAIVCSQAPLDEAGFQDQLTHALSRLQADHARPYGLRASVGVASQVIGVHPPDVVGLLEAADQRMYRGKTPSGGRAAARSGLT